MRVLLWMALLGLPFHAVFGQTISVAVATSADDAEERQNGASVSLTSSDLEMVNDGASIGDQAVGIRFVDVLLPAGVTIVNAYIQFTADGGTSEPTSLEIRAEKTAASAVFVNAPFNVTERAVTEQSVSWPNIVAWTSGQATAAQRTPNVAALIEEIIAETGWQTGNPLTFIITGTGRRRAVAYDGGAVSAPVLVIQYQSNLSADLGVNALLAPERVTFTSAETPVRVTVQNFGTEPQAGFEVSYALDGGQPVTETLAQTLLPGEAIEYTFATLLDLGQEEQYDLAVAVSLPGDLNPLNDALSVPIFAVPRVEDLFFGQGSGWAYKDDGSDQGTAWRAPGFDDSGWALGVGHFGFGDGDETTLLTPGAITYYFRKTVHVPDASALSSVYFHIVHDDGALLYINGVEAVRSELMPAGDINYLTGTTTFIPTAQENDFFVYEVDPSLFTDGENTLAIEVHNQNFTSSDVSFDCFVTDALVFDTDGPYVFYRNGEVVVKYVTEAGPSVETYTDPSSVTLTCTLPAGLPPFSFGIKTALAIEPSIYELPEKFLAISDIEGEIEAFVTLLRDAGVIDSTYNWTYGDGHLFFVGDMFDRGRYVTECLWLLYKLEEEAEAQGGKVHFVMGNHDIMNLIGDFRYVNSKYSLNAALLDETLLSLYAGDSELGRWLRTKNILERAGDIAFVHAGISPTVQALGLSYDQINDWGRYRMDNLCGNDVACATVNGGSATGIYWYRGMAQSSLSQAEVNDILDDFGADKIVIGHTVFDNISLLYEGRVVAIDLSHAQNFSNGFMSALVYQDSCLYDFQTQAAGQTYTALGACGLVNTTQGLVPAGSIEVFPNPIGQQATVRLPALMVGGAPAGTSIQVSDVAGRLMHTAPFRQGEHQAAIDLSRCPPGLYVLRVTGFAQAAMVVVKR